jgi:hypothetical protein
LKSKNTSLMNAWFKASWTVRRFFGFKTRVFLRKSMN